jgi:hypothetical protein
MSCHQAAGENHNVSDLINCLENVTQFKYFWTSVTNENCVHEEIKEQFKSGECLLPWCWEFFFSPLMS